MVRVSQKESARAMKKELAVLMAVLMAAVRTAKVVSESPSNYYHCDNHHRDRDKQPNWANQETDTALSSAS